MLYGAAAGDYNESLVRSSLEHCGQSAEDDDRLSPLAEPLENLNEELSLVALFLNELWQQAQMALQGSVGSER